MMNPWLGIIVASLGAVAAQGVCAAAGAPGPSVDLAFVSIRDGDAHIYTHLGGVDHLLTQGKSVNTQPAWSSDGRIAFTSSRNGVPRIYVMNEDGSGQRRLTQDDRIELAASWSPDGKWIAFFSSATDARGDELRVVEVSSGKPVSITAEVKDKGSTPPTWSADGSRIAFVGRAEGAKAEVWVVNRDGSALRNVSAKFAARAKAWASISPDGKSVAYVADIRGTQPVVVADVETAESTVLTRAFPGAYESPRWSPDGKQLAVASSRDDPASARNDIFVINADGTGLRNLSQDPGEDFDPQWSGDGKSVVFSSLRTGTSQLFQVDLDSGKTSRISNNPSHDMDPVLRPVAKR